MTVRPAVQVQGAHLGDMTAQLPVDPRAFNADQGAQVKAGPAGAAGAAVGACAVARQLAQAVGGRGGAAAIVRVEPAGGGGVAAARLEGGVDLLLYGCHPLLALLLRAELELPLSALQRHDH